VADGDVPYIRTHRIISTLLAPLLVVLLTAGAIVSVTLLGNRVDSSRRSQLAVGALSETVRGLLAAPFSADPAFNSGPDARSPDLSRTVKAEIRADEAKLSNALLRAGRAGAPAAVVAAGRAGLAKAKPVVARVYELATTPGGLRNAGPKNIAAAQGELTRQLGTVSASLKQIERADGASADRARRQAEMGTIVAMLLLLAVFGYFYFRSHRLTRENEDLLGLSREEASTDVLTGLGNRRALIDELSRSVTRQAPGGHELLVAIFDLDGFKQYNDSFGHAAGDALLTRLGERFSAAVGTGTTYRMGGDEFCMLAWCAPDSAAELLDAALEALNDRGEGWHISCSQGAIWVPSEAATPSEALKLADVRMYANKASRSWTGRQVADALLQVLTEQDKGVDTHGDHVAELSAEVARALRQPDFEVQRIRLAATLHDIGKTAIPEAVLNKPGPLDEQEWRFMHRHTLIGERIVLAAPALAGTASLIRSSHERFDGNGYPDGLRGGQIPLGSRIIAACDAFDAMTTARSYREAGTVDAALEELKRCSGSQFDPGVVESFCQTVTSARRSHESPKAHTGPAPVALSEVFPSQRPPSPSVGIGVSAPSGRGQLPRAGGA
jgi:diguanylate cyclase (GGDEF)-like protein